MLVNFYAKVFIKKASLGLFTPSYALTNDKQYFRHKTSIYLISYYRNSCILLIRAVIHQQNTEVVYRSYFHNIEI